MIKNTINEIDKEKIENNTYRVKCFSFEDNIMNKDINKCNHKEYHQNSKININSIDKDNSINILKNNDDICHFIKIYKDDFWDEDEDTENTKIEVTKDKNIFGNSNNYQLSNNNNININDLIIDNQLISNQNTNYIFKKENKIPIPITSKHNNNKNTIKKEKSENNNKTKVINEITKDSNKININLEQNTQLNINKNQNKSKNKNKKNRRPKTSKVQNPTNYHYYSNNEEENQYFEKTILNIKNNKGKSDPVKLYHYHDKDWSKNRFLSDLRKKEMLLFK